jgi:L-alanine-DL-glutamate epimerase-like enolase superfamily enzyme
MLIPHPKPVAWGNDCRFTVDMRFQILQHRFDILPMRTRFPFRYGIASLSALPHLFVQVEMAVNGQVVKGLASEGLAPKWFTKDPTSSTEADLAEMISVIQNAMRIGKNAAQSEVDFFSWWQALYGEQSQWGRHMGMPGLLSNFGASLIERAVVDGLCKAAGLPLHEVLRRNVLGIELPAVRPDQAVAALEQAIHPPADQMHVRHTVGLADALTAEDAEPLDDGLPQTLDESIQAYGLRYFKIKVCGQLDSDIARLERLTEVLTAQCDSAFYCTLDGNEQFTSMAAFREFYHTMQRLPKLEPLLRSILLLEQPLHRNVALDDSVGESLKTWTDAPPMIIDESDGSLDDLPRALALGYGGVSHKNCKGVVKSLANAALVKAQDGLLSGEDLASVGPVAMLKDLAMAAALGIRHVERNGHHYFRGLSAFNATTQASVLKHHGDLYGQHEEGFPVLKIAEGVLEIASVNRAPFGFAGDVDLDALEPLGTWIKRGGLSDS